MPYTLYYFPKDLSFSLHNGQERKRFSLDLNILCFRWSLFPTIQHKINIYIYTFYILNTTPIYFWNLNIFQIQIIHELSCSNSLFYNIVIFFVTFYIFEMKIIKFIPIKLFEHICILRLYSLREISLILLYSISLN